MDNLILEAKLEFQDLVFGWHHKGLNYKQIWAIVHELLKMVTTELIGECACEVKK
jgi:hypothetical protein